jgi:hypothetical protein
VIPERWERVNSVFRRALERAPQERAAVLAEACGSDEALRREAEALLAAHAQTGAFLESQTVEGAAAATVAEQLPSLVGQQVGRYQVLAPLGAGGMGEVYLAQDTQLRRRVALKLLPAFFSADPERVRRFEQEARAAAQLAHPNVCVIHEVGQAGDGRHFIAMEYIQGETLRQRHLAS